MKKHFGEYIKQLRNEGGFTLTQLGAKLDLDSANLSKIENGKRDFNEKSLGKLASVFKLDINKLKTEFFSDIIAKKLYQNGCSTDALIVAEEKVKYLKKINLKQTEVDL